MNVARSRSATVENVERARPDVALALRPYQREAKDAISASPHRRQIVALPTGTGKMVIFAHLIAECAARGQRAIVLVHRDELVTQTLEKLAVVAPGLPVGVVKAERDEHIAPVVVASVQTLARPHRLQRLAPAFALVIVKTCVEDPARWVAEQERDEYEHLLLEEHARRHGPELDARVTVGRHLP